MILQENNEHDYDNEIVEREPLITNIQRYSLQDGPGIRTTVFLKGCPLRCPWCHNPETQTISPEINYYINKCTGCARCAAICSHGATYIEKGSENSFLKFDRSKCIGCGKCIKVCLADAREIVGKKWLMEEIIKEAVADRLFFENSGGGVTISGGDPIYFPEFTLKLAKKLHQENIHVAIETAAFGKWNHFQKLMPYVSLFLIDIKTMDSAKYKQVIRGDLDVVLTNLEKLVEAGAKARVRLPIIPGFNNNQNDYQAYASYLGNLIDKIQAVDILPFHSYGEKKYELLGKTENYHYRDFNSSEGKEMKPLIDMLAKVGFIPGTGITVGGLIGIVK
jgi:pyruvate formate lyase activating enzyme